MRNSGLTLVLLLSLLACEQQTTSPMADLAPSFAAADVDKNLVLRYQDHLAASWTDPSNGLRATHTTFPIPDGDVAETDCGPQADLAMIDFQQVGAIDPIDFFQSDLHLSANGPVWVIVRDVNQIGDCYGAKLVAEGPGEIRYLDNDALGATPGQPSVNSWGFNARGTLTTPDGHHLEYQGNSRFVAKATSGEEPRFMPVVRRVTLR
jgi:hypothetical protein